MSKLIPTNLSKKTMRLAYVGSLLVMLLSIVMPAMPVSALTWKAINDINNYKPWYDKDDTTQPCSATDSSGSDVVITGDNVKDSYQFFAANGFSPQQSAGIVGNLMLESGVNPTQYELSGQGGYGIAQFSPPTGMRTWVSAQPAPNNNPDTLQGQLAFLLYVLTTGWRKAAGAALKQTTTVPDAATVFQNEYEHPLDTVGSLQQRIKNANKVYSLYSGDTSAPANGGAASDCSGSNTNVGSPDCASAVGSTKILCEALKYDPVSYQEVYLAGHQGGAAWHKTCLTIDASCILDCSGLVTVAAYDAFGNSGSWVTGTLLSDTANWKIISASELQPGDLVEPSIRHVEIVQSIKGISITTFGAHSSHKPQPDQVSTETYMKTTDSGNVYLRYVGQGV